MLEQWVQIIVVLMEEQEVQPKHQPLQAQLYTTLQVAAEVELLMEGKVQMVVITLQEIQEAQTELLMETLG